MAWLDRHSRAAQSFAALVATAAAVAALIFAAGQVTEMRRQTEVGKATNLWLEYARLGMEYPELPLPPPGPVDTRLNNAPRYYIYVTILMWAADESLEAEEFGERWRRTIEFQLGLHRAYFCGDWNQFRTARPALVRLVEQWRSRNCRTPAASSRWTAPAARPPGQRP